MKILHFIDSFEIYNGIDPRSLGGMEKLLIDCLNFEKENDHVLVYFIGTNPKIDLITNHRCKAIKINGIGWKKIFIALFSLYQVIQREKVDAIHAHSFFSEINSKILSFFFRKKFIVTYHTPVFFLEKSKKRMGEFKKCISRIFTSNYRQHHIFVSKKVENVISKSLNINRNKHISYVFAHPDFYNTSNKKTEYALDSTLKMICIGNLKPLKNHELIIKALAKINIPLSFQLDIYGEGFYRKHLENIIQTHELDKKITLKGTHNNLAPVLKNYDLFVFPSTFEGFGISLIEAMGVGLPVLCNEIDSFKDILENSENQIFKYCDENDLIKKLEWIVSLDKNEREALGTSNRKIAQKYSIENYISNLHRVYNL